MSHRGIQAGDCWVIKIGSSLVTDDGRGLAGGLLSSWVDEIALLAKSRIQISLSGTEISMGQQHLCGVHTMFLKP